MESKLLWALVALGGNRAVESGNAAGPTLGAPLLLAPGLLLPGLQRPGWLFKLATLSLLLTATLLLVGALYLTLWRKRAAVTPGALLGAALLGQTLALLLQGAAAQWAWGAYWSWDPIECWRLAAWLGLALAAFAHVRLAWRGRRATLTLWGITLFTWASLLGAGPLVQELGLTSLYLGPGLWQ